MIHKALNPGVVRRPRAVCYVATTPLPEVHTILDTLAKVTSVPAVDIKTPKIEYFREPKRLHPASSIDLAVNASF